MRKLRRRDFMRVGSTLAASIALPYFVKSDVLGGPGRTGANDRIRIAVIGVGVRGNQLIDNLPPEGQVVAICDPDARRLNAITTKHNAHWALYDDYRKLLEVRDDLDGVIICTPHHQHVLPGILACEAGLDVYVEKPLSLYVQEGRALVEAARRHRRVVQVGSQQRSMEMNRFACELVKEGHIGKVRWVEAVSFPGPTPYPFLPEQSVPRGFNWDYWQGPAPEHPFNSCLAMDPPGWRRWRDYSGRGTDMWAHSLDMIQYALGEDESGPVEFWPVSGEGPTTRIDFRYASGIEVRQKFDALATPRKGPRLGAVFVGETCKIEINRNKFTTNPVNFVRSPPDPELAQKWEGPGWIARGHIQNWFDCMKSRDTPNADVEIGHRTVTIAHICNIARELNRRLHWDPVLERFTDDEEADRLLIRQRREGWELPNSFC